MTQLVDSYFKANGLTLLPLYIIQLLILVKIQNILCTHDSRLNNNDLEFPSNHELFDNKLDNEIHIKKESLTSHKYNGLLKNIKMIKELCGALCETFEADISQKFKHSLEPKKVYQRIDRIPNCNALWNNSVFDISSTFNVPLQKLPKYLLQYFTHNGQMKISYNYLDDTNSENHTTNSWGTRKCIRINYSKLFVE